MDEKTKKKLEEFYRWTSFYSRLLTILLKDTRYTKKQIEKLLLAKNPQR